MNSRFLLFFCLCLVCFEVPAQQKCLPHSHAHNDYRHRQPLRDALSCNFSSIEADIFLKNGKLLVAHTRPLIGKNTLEELYLEPLKKICAERNGRIYDSVPLILLIDIKSDATETYLILKNLLAKYAEILTVADSQGNIQFRAVTVILSGNRPGAELTNDSLRYVFLDRSLLYMETDRFSHLHLMASTKYSNVFNWKGKGALPETEKEKLVQLCSSAHQQGMKVRLWASPENEDVWKVLLECGVDLINTDDLERLEAFLTSPR